MPRIVVWARREFQRRGAASPYDSREVPSEIEPTDVLDRLPLRFLIGTTATGKSELALELAPRLGAEIVALDSMTVYRGLDVGTAKPSRASREAVRHHLIDVADPAEPYDLQRYLADVRRALEEIERRGAVPLFVGGTGLYLAGLLRGLFSGPPSDPAIRAELDERARVQGSAALHAELEVIDPPSASRIHPNDRRRIVRALEVWLQTGKPLSGLQAQWGADPTPRERRSAIVGLRIPTEELDAGIRARTIAMLHAGWPDEAVRLADAGAMGRSAEQALGYDVAEALGRGLVAFEAAADAIALRTRQFARRQRTWFRRFEVSWLDPRATDSLDRALDLFRAATGTGSAGAQEPRDPA
ncbi:MAG: tRNA (adenosine(37)-N6)-dimethylallyltransferase MiaA [Planctomycetota bacterium]